MSDIGKEGPRIPTTSWEQIRAMQLSTPYSETLRAFFARSKEWRAQPRQPISEEELRNAIKQQVIKANAMVQNYHNPDLKMMKSRKVFAQGLARPEIGQQVLTRLYFGIDSRHSADAFSILIDEFSKAGCMRDIDIAFNETAIEEGRTTSDMLVIYEPQSRPVVLNKILSAYRLAKEQHPDVFNLTPRQREAVMRHAVMQFKAPIDANLSFVEMDPEDAGKSWDTDEVREIRAVSGINHVPIPSLPRLTDEDWLKKQEAVEKRVVWTKKAEEAIKSGNVKSGDQLEYKRKLSTPALVQRGTITAK